MDGVAGHAGLFSTAADLSRFCRMLLGGGTPRRARGFCRRPTVARMTSPSTPAGDARRARPRLGHRLVVSRRTAASCFRSDRSATPASPARRCGSIPATKELRDLPVEPRASRRQGRRDARCAARSRRSPPRRCCRRTTSRDGCSATRLRRARLAARRRARRSRRARRTSRCSPASTCSRAESFARLRGKRVGLLTNQTGRVARRREHDRSARAARRASRSPRCSAPSTASAARLDDKVASSRDEKTGLPIHSLYGDDAAADRRDARRPRRRRRRSAGRRRALLHLPGDDRLRAGGSGEAQAAGRRARSAEPDRRLRHRRAGAGRGRQSASSATCRCRCATA